MISRDKLNQIKAQLRRDGHTYGHKALQLLHTLVDHGIEAVDLLDGGVDAVERERQIRLGLEDLYQALLHARLTAPSRQVDKAIYTLDMVRQMLKAKGADWKRGWDWYRPRIDEEFSEVDAVARSTVPDD
jgi:hypothetical protein